MRWDEFQRLQRECRPDGEIDLGKIFALRAGAGWVEFSRALLPEIDSSEIAGALGVSLRLVQKWRTGATEPELWQALAMLERYSHEVVRFFRGIGGFEDLPGLGPRICAARLLSEVKRDHPWASTVGNLADGADAIDAAATARAIAARLGIEAHTCLETLQRLVDAGSLRIESGRYRPLDAGGTDTTTPGRFQDTARCFEYWAGRMLPQIATLQTRSDHLRFGYLVGVVDDAALAALTTLTREFYMKAAALVHTPVTPKDGKVIGLNFMLFDEVSLRAEPPQ